MSLNDPVNPGMDPGTDPQSQTPNPTNTNSEVKGSFQDRVNQLTRRATDAEQVASSTVAENSELRNQLTRLETQLSQLSAPRQVAPAVRETEPNSGAGQPGQFEALAKQITENVLGAVTPVLNEVRQGKADTQLAEANRQSFTKAATVHRDLQNQESELFKTFSTLWDGRPDLHGIAGAPELLAEAARGLLTDSQASAQVRKLAAADTPSIPRTIDTVNEKDDISKALDTLSASGKTEGWDNDDMSDFLSLKFKQFGRTGQ